MELNILVESPFVSLEHGREAVGDVVLMESVKANVYLLFETINSITDCNSDKLCCANLAVVVYRTLSSGSSEDKH